MKKIIFNILSVFLCGLTTLAAADYCSPNHNDCCEWSLFDGKMTIGADWLYWKVQQDGVLPGRIVFEDSFTENDVTVPFTITKGIHPDPKWDSGFRVYLGYELPCDCWDMNICYTYIPSRNKLVNFTALENESFSSATSDNHFSFFASKWNLNLNNIDFDIGRTVCFGECLKIRPHAGFRATWFNQKFRSFGAFAPIGEAEQTIVSFDANAINQRFQGYGVEAGLWADYRITCGLSLVGHFGGSILYSKFKVCNREAFGNVDVVDDLPITSVIPDDGLIITSATVGGDSFFTATPSVDYFVGLQYDDTLCDMFYKVYVGWEQHVLFDTNRFLSTGNLSMQGLTLGLQVGF